MKLQKHLTDTFECRVNFSAFYLPQESEVLGLAANSNESLLWNTFARIPIREGSEMPSVLISTGRSLHSLGSFTERYQGRGGGDYIFTLK